MADNSSYMKPVWKLVYVPSYKPHRMGCKSNELNANNSKDIEGRPHRETLESPIRFGM